jgi:membrane-associated phospholipid phosphatase
MKVAARPLVSTEAATALVGAVLLPLAVFAVLAVTVSQGTPGWDDSVLRLSDRNGDSEVAILFDRLFVHGFRATAVLAAIAVALSAVGRRWSLALFWVVALAGVLVLDSILKEAFHRTPLGSPEGGYSFPSGNAMGSVALVTALAVSLPSQWRRPTVIAATPLLLAYGAGIVYSGWHYPSDVLAGWCVGLAWVVGVWLLLGRPLVAKPRGEWGNS